MARVDYTKQIIAGSLIELMQSQKFDSISIGDLVQNCGISRHTFYYHFEDKFALLKYIFDQFAATDFPIPSAEEIATGRIFYIREIINHMYKYKAFYTNIFNSSASVFVSDCLFDYITGFREVQIDGLLRGRRISDAGRNFIATYFTCAIDGMIMRWARNGMVEPLEVFFMDYKDVATQSIEMLVDKYSI